MTLGAKIASNRNRLTLSQDQLAEKIHISTETLKKWETNIIEPNRDQRETMAELFQINPDELVSDDDGQPIFRDHQEDKPINVKKFRKIALISLLVGYFFWIATFFIGFIALTPALVALGVSTVAFNYGNALMPLWKKVLYFFVFILIIPFSLQIIPVLLFVVLFGLSP